MGLSESFETITRVLRQYESEGRTVDLVDVTTRGDGDSNVLTATVDVSVPLCPTNGADEAVTPRSASVGDDGTLQIAFPSSVVTPDVGEEDAVSLTVETARVTDGTVVATIELAVRLASAVDGDAGAVADQAGAQSVTEIDGTTLSGPSDRSERDEAADSDACEGEDVAAKLAATRNEDVPPYEDTEYLQCLYDTFDTFDEMREHLEMDVASETVRRYMIDAGIHEPTSYDTDGDADLNDSDAAEGDESGATSADASGERADETLGEEDVSCDASSGGNATVDGASEQQIATDGIGLPDHIQIDDVVDAVVDSMTLYEVQQELDLRRCEAQDLLRQLNLLDLVMRRVSENPEQPPSHDLVTRRIREGAAGSA